MNRRWLRSGALVACTLFTACGGPGNAVSNNVTPPVPEPTPAAPVDLSGTETQHYTYYHGFPERQPPSTIDTHVVQRISIATGGAPKGFLPGSNRIASIVETDKTKLETNSSRTIAYIREQPAQDMLYGSSTQVTAAGGAQSSTSTTVYSVPRIVAKAPGEKWTNSAARQVDERYSDGHGEVRTYAAGGTYVEKGTVYGNDGKLEPTVIQDVSSGAGSYSGPFAGCPPDTTFGVTAPAGNPATISLALTSSNKYCSAAAAISFPAWFAANPAFYRETDSSTQTNVPTSCSQSHGDAATDIRLQSHFLDTIIGYDEETTSDSYIISGSIACVVYSDAMVIYYDYQGDSPSTVLTPHKAKPIAKTVTQETLQPSGARAALAELASGALERHFVATLEPERERMRAALIHFMDAQGVSR